MDSSLTDLVVIPRNGYANRLQAWASAALLAQELSVPLSVVWEAEDIAPAEFGDLFVASPDGPKLLAAEALRERISADHRELPRYLNVDPERRLIVLAGHDRGEQTFMDKLDAALSHPCRPTLMVIIAGGKFTWDSANMKSNREDVNALLYPNYRKGWAKEDLKV